jgi:hypothetical protein
MLCRKRQTAAIHSISEACWMQEFLLPNGRTTLLWSFYDQRVKTTHTHTYYVCVCVEDREQQARGAQ